MWAMVKFSISSFSCCCSLGASFPSSFPLNAVILKHLNDFSELKVEYECLRTQKQLKTTMKSKRKRRNFHSGNSGERDRKVQWEYEVENLKIIPRKMIRLWSLHTHCQTQLQMIMRTFQLIMQTQSALAWDNYDVCQSSMKYLRVDLNFSRDS